MRWNGAREYLRQRIKARWSRLGSPPCEPPRRPHTQALGSYDLSLGGHLCESGRSLGCRADARADPEPQPRRGRRHQAQAHRRVRRPREHRRGAPERCADALPEGWVEPGQRPDFDEWTLVLDGTLRVEHETGVFEVPAEQAVVVRGGEWVQYSTPYPGGAEYVAVCLPAFAPDTVHRDDDGA